MNDSIDVCRTRAVSTASVDLRKCTRTTQGRSGVNARHTPRVLRGFLSLMILLVVTSVVTGCAQTAPPAAEALDDVLTWLKAEPTEASGPTHVWTIADDATLRRHTAGPNPGLDSALGPFLVQEDTYYFAFADQPGEQWYEFTPEDMDELWTADEFTQEQREGLATLLVVMRLADPVVLLSRWDPSRVSIKAGETDDTWLLTGTIDSLEAAGEGLSREMRDAVAEDELYPGDIDVELIVSADDGRPLEARFNPENDRPFRFGFSRTDDIPEPPESTIGIRELLRDGPVGSPAPE